MSYIDEVFKVVHDQNIAQKEFLQAVELDPIPQMVKHPRENPYYFWYPEDFED